MKKLPVPVPERTVITNVKNYKYVYLTQSVEYKKELKRSVPKRIAIGRLNEDGMLIPNHHYYELFDSVEELMEPTDRSDRLSVGPLFLMDSIASKIDLKELLYDVFDTKIMNRVLDIASYMIMTESNAMHYFEDYAYSHALFSDEVFSDSSIDRLLKEISTKDIDLFISNWVKIHANKQIYVAYDSTNMNSVAGNLELVEYGHAKDNQELPQINVSLGYDQTNGVPLFYEMYPGSIIDNSECKKMVERAARYGCEKIGFILDRGYFSLSNIRFFEDNGYDYVLMTKGNAKFIQDVINQVGATLRNGYTHYLSEYELYGTTVEVKLFDTKKKQYVHVYYDGVRAEEEKILVNKRFEKIDQELSELLDKKIKRREDVMQYEKYYRLRYDDNGYFEQFQRKDEEIKKLINRTGIFTIITSEEIEAEEALNIYRDRDAVEKVFRMDKSYLGNSVFRVHKDEHLESKVFITFVALILRNEIWKSLKGLYKKNKNEFTVLKVLKEIEKLSVTKMSDGNYHQRYKLTAKQAKILNANGVNETKYNEYVSKIKVLLNH